MFESINRVLLTTLTDLSLALREEISNGMYSLNPHLEDIIVDVLSKRRDDKVDALLFLSQCNDRLLKETSIESDLKLKLSNIIVNYSRLSIIIPDIYSNISPFPTFIELILNNNSLVNDLILPNDPQDIVEIFHPLIDYLLKKKKSSLRVLMTLLRNYPAPLKHIIQSHPSFTSLNYTSSPQDAKDSFLGHLFSDEPSPSLNLDSYFSNFNPLILQELEDSDFSIFSTIEYESFSQKISNDFTLRTSEIHSFLLLLIRNDPIMREKIIHWFQTLSIINDDRTKMMMELDATKSNSNYFLLQAQDILFKFSEPFISPQMDKLKLIQTEYLFSLLSFSEGEFSLLGKGAFELTKLSPDLQETSKDEEVCKNSKEPPNFITQIFLLTLNYLRISYQKTLSSLKELNTKWSQVLKINKTDIPPLLARIQQLRLQIIIQQIFIDSSNPLIFSIGLSEWLTTLGQKIAKVPEFFLEIPLDICDSIGEKLRISFPTRATSLTFQDYFLQLKKTNMIPLIEYLDRKDIIKNPYLRSRFIPLLICLENFKLLPFQSHLPLRLIVLYLEVEMTGASSQFYDKFNIRHGISILLGQLWSNSEYHFIIGDLSCKALVAKMEDNLTNNDGLIFLRFMNLLLNDATFLIDEGLNKLVQLNNPSLEGREGIERQAQAYCQLGLSTLEMLRWLSEDSSLIGGWKRTEIVDRLARMLFLNLTKMVGPSSVALKVKDPLKYGWEPKKFLGLLVDLVLNFSIVNDNTTAKNDPFIQALVNDDRSCHKEVFLMTIRILEKHSIRPSHQIERLSSLYEIVFKERNIPHNNNKNSAEDEEIPDEFLDPLLFTIMRDPVLLKTSNTVIDRATINSHLLNDPTDPFNRQPLGQDQIIELSELREKIENFINSK